MYHLDNTHDLEKCLCFPSWKGIRDPPDPPAVSCTFCPAARPGAEFCLGESPGPAQSRSGLLFSGSGGPQERFKSFSSGFLRGSASKIRFGPHFGPILGVQNETPGLEKNITIPARVVKNQGFAVLSLVCFRTPIWGTPWAPLWEGN